MWKWNQSGNKLDDTLETDIHAGGWSGGVKVKGNKWLMHNNPWIIFVLVFNLLDDAVRHKDGAEVEAGWGWRGRTSGTFKEQLISAGSLFVISGNPSWAWFSECCWQSGETGDGRGDECMSAHLHHRSGRGFNHHGRPHSSRGRPRPAARRY